MFASRMPSRCDVCSATCRSSSTPTTVSQLSPTLIGRPTGSSVVKKRERTPWPMMHTGAAPSDLRVGKRRAIGQRHVEHAEVARVHADELARAPAPFAGDHRLEHDLAARGIDVGDDRRDAPRILHREPGRETLLLLLVLFLRDAFLLLDERRDDDVVRAQQLHLLEDLLLGAAPDGEHRDHRGDAEEDAERRQRRRAACCAAPPRARCAG